jgi:hypothetical protein
MFRSLRSAAIIALAILATAAPAFADPAMTFKSIGLMFGVLAEGDITADTPKVFEQFLKQDVSVMRIIQFNSGGGDLGAGLDLGRAIRRAGWSTGVAIPSQIGSASAGECDSACTFAYLGGVTRSMAPGSKYGVHRFWKDDGKIDDQDVQVIAGQLVAYIHEMGVSADMYTLMTQAGKGDQQFVQYLDVPTMTKLRIMTTHVVTAVMDDANGLAVLHLIDKDSGGGETYGQLDFYCNGPDLMARASFVYVPDLSNPPRVTVQWIFQPGNQRVTVPADAWNSTGRVNNHPAIEIYVPPQLFNNDVIPAQSVEVDVSLGGGMLDAGWDRIGDSQSLSIPSLFRTLVRTVATSCH